VRVSGRLLLLLFPEYREPTRVYGREPGAGKSVSGRGRRARFGLSHSREDYRSEAVTLWIPSLRHEVIGHIDDDHTSPEEERPFDQ
jgi:hypothetical protein